ncbi:toll/interleukin-1 receptor domain-containing protein [Bradyrhizobium sp. 195]|uniref:toll/interleukin-1 receptor domain-containing protein n=1 Tax=Bradyrhizobium sp. 195 TaxID=2782662 RepID=UPI0020014944|nr:TIR domain-containing protein [Bradyrhizobium sp. 195]UPK26912.1 TIR domain-containing protein [Bradyrhizobium sp. 195]
MDAAIAAKAAVAATSNRDRKTRVFISYSRKDSVFSNRLVDALNARGFEAYLDKKDILPGEPWQERLDALILSADAIGIVISPDLIASPVCAWEAERTESLQKKLLPLVYRPVADADLPPRLARLNYILLRDEDDFDVGLSALADALDTDIAWIRQHTRIGELAQRWDGAGRPASGGRLLRGEELADAEAWLLTSPKGAPDPTELQRAYVHASRLFETGEIEKERAAIARTRRFQRRSAWALAGIALLVVTGAGYVLWQQRETDRREILVMTSAAHRAIAEKRYDTAMRIAVEGLPPPGRLPVTLGWSTREVAGLEAKLAGAAQLSRLQRVLSGHTDTINSVAISTDGTRIVSGSSDRTARVWDSRSGELLHELKHEGAVGRVAFSSDGRRVFTASSNGSDSVLRSWDAVSGTPSAAIKVASSYSSVRRIFLVSGTFSTDGKRALVATTYSRANVWDLTSGKILAELQIKTRPASATISGDGTRAIVGGMETAQIWDTTNSTMLHELAGHKDYIHAVAFSADGTKVATGAGDRLARVWDAVTGKLIREFEPHDAEVKAVAFSADGSALVTTSADQTVRLLSIATGGLLLELKGHDDAVTGVAFSADGRIVTGSSDRTLRIWDATSEPPPLRHDNPVVTAAFDATGSRVITLSGAARIWDAATGNMLRELPLNGFANDAAFSPDNALILTLSENMVRVWDASTGDTIREFRDDEGIYGARFIADRTSPHIVLMFRKRAAIWDAKSGTLVRELKDHGGGYGSPGVSADGRLISDSRGDHARIWDAATGTLVREIVSPGGIWTTALSPDGKRLTTTGFSGLVRVWNTDTGDMLRELRGHAAQVSSTAFSADGTRIITASNDRTAQIWDAASGEVLRVIEGHGRGLQTAVFSPDGGRVLTSSMDGTARIWDVSFGMTLHGDALVRTVCMQKLAGAQTFTIVDAIDPILVGLAGVNPCRQHGPLSSEYWTDLGRAVVERFKKLIGRNSRS